MDEQSQKTFDAILKKDLTELTPEDKAFLSARRGYMNPVQKDFYKDILEEVAIAVEAKLERERNKTLKVKK
jgi:hypothetical protein